MGAVLLERIQLVRNVGQFDSVNAGAQIPLSTLTLIYGENGRGKTTLSSILRSLASGDAGLVQERHRLGAANPPHVVLGFAGNITAQFQNNAWSAAVPRIAIFDDAFVAANVCSGVEIAAGHRQNLHELILGAQGVALNGELQGHVTRIEEHNRALTQRSNAIPAAARGTFNVDDFCALAPDPDIEAAIADGERALAAARSADAIRQQAVFLPLSLPPFDIEAINALLARTLPDLEAEAAARVRAHLRNLGRGGEVWVGEGMSRIAGASQGQGHDFCPFCSQDLAGSALIEHYQAYFSGAYEGLKTTITITGQGINTAHAGEIPAAFERAVRIASDGRTFWSAFTDMPAIDVDTAAVLRDWIAARDGVLLILRVKAAAPLEAMSLPPEAIALIAAYDARREAIAGLSNALQACNAPIAILKEQAANADVAARAGDLARLQAVRSRHSDPVSSLCEAYLAEKAEKTATEALRAQARTALDNYRQNIFPAYEAAIRAVFDRYESSGIPKGLIF